MDAVIFCEAPVARRMHRAIAAALDWAMVLIAYGLFLAVFRLAGGQFVLNRTTWMVFAGDLALIAMAYGLVWLLAGSETAGMRWTRLRLITFDGFPPDLKHRLARFAGSCLSVCSVIGLLWSLSDEESLTWQDHISRTFPTPHESETDVLRRR
ncbi:MAG: RDD family protein [Bryobacteraceae bacterium]